MTVIRFRRGNKADIPALAPSGMPLWCEDTKQLYLGTGDDVHLIGENNNIAGDLVSYSVNSGNVDNNGYADLISKVSDTSVSFKVGGIYTNMGITFPNGNVYIISSIPNITNLSENGTYIFIVQEDSLVLQEDGTYSATVTALSSNITEDNILPTVTVDGDLALLINQRPLKPYFRQNSGWIEKQFLKIGQVQKLSGLLGTPISYAFNGYAIVEKAVPAAYTTLIDFYHNIGCEIISTLELICLSADKGYQPGQKATWFHVLPDGNNREINNHFLETKLFSRYRTSTTAGVGEDQIRVMPANGNGEVDGINYTKWKLRITSYRSF
ncbi:MAG TPA: hypothetical protein P5556_01655 [Candidatus Gastranaerophilales bacterium]|nr:hypothetical protein [Candidatus Gastranaerophilales bacterium]